jgi:predicted hotdog family 3-hydroxylacyl-ACP dehydratase
MSSYAIEDLLPHAEPMILIDRLGAVNQDQFEAFADINSASMFATKDGVPAYVGLEYMAQSIAAYAGWKALKNGGHVKEGFLLGSREVSFPKAYIPLGLTLKIICQEVLHDQEMAVFDCRIEDAQDGFSYGACKLNVFQPQDPKNFIQQLTHE